jgi:hypothetical protein
MSNARDTSQTQACQICFNKIEISEAPVSCPKCKALYHKECWDEYGGCSVYGCEKAPEYKKNELEEKYAGAVWGRETKNCPFCSESIPMNTLRCPACGEEFKDVLQTDRRSIYRAPVQPVVADPREKETQNVIYTFFFLSLLGCMSPFIILFATIWYYQTRERIVKLSPIFRLLLGASIIFSFIYVVLFFGAIMIGKMK